MNEPDIKLLCLDFDGVVLESNIVRDQAWEMLFLSESNNIRKNIVEFHRNNPGIDRAEKILLIYEKLLGKSISKDEINNKLGYFQKYCIDTLMVIPEVPGFSKFVNEVNVPVVILSAAREDEVKKVCDGRGLFGFSTIKGGPINKYQNLLQIIKDYRINADQILMVGDQISDRNVAYDVGCYFVGRIAPDRPAKFGENTHIIHDMNMSWNELKRYAKKAC